MKFVRTVLSTWYFYAFVFLWILGNCSEAFSSQALLNLYMKSHPTIKFSVSQLNNYPTGVQAIGIVSTLLWAFATDLYGKRWLSGYYNAVVGIAASEIILAPTTSTAGIFGAYYWAGSIYCCQATFFAWANDSMRGQDHTVRAFVVASMNCGGNTFQAFWPLIFYAADMAPMFTVILPLPILSYDGIISADVNLARNVVYDRCFYYISHLGDGNGHLRHKIPKEVKWASLRWNNRHGLGSSRL
jgi:ACS family pantothenate transporter-like MFS transporter